MTWREGPFRNVSKLSPAQETRPPTPVEVTVYHQADCVSLPEHPTTGCDSYSRSLPVFAFGLLLLLLHLLALLSCLLVLP